MREPVDSTSAQRLLDRALAGDAEDLATLVDLLTPVVQARVARTLLVGRPAGENRGVREQVKDATQDVFMALFADDARILRDWRPELGLSLLNFVGLVARRRTLSRVRTAKGNPWKESPTRDDRLDRRARSADPERRAASRERLRLLVRRMQEALSPLGWHLFELLMIEECSVAEVKRRTGLRRDAIYAWRSRLRKLARRLAEEYELVSDPARDPRND